MKLCSQCQFIYEDDQECCDMDGAALVYEPTLESVFQTAFESKANLERSLPAKLNASASIAPLSVTSTTSGHVFAARGRLVLQVAACLMLTVMAFIAFYFAPRLVQTKAQTSNDPVKIQATTDKLGTSPAAGVAPALNADTPAERRELENSKLAPSSLSHGLQTPHSKANASFPELPGVKPLPHLKPLPTLKPLPRLQAQNRSISPSRKAPIVKESIKKQSRFGSFLKKTGRILKKPFKS